VKAAQLEAKKALRVANEEQAHLAELKQKKLLAEKLEIQRLAALERERKAKILADKMEKQKERKLLVSKEKESRLARIKLERVQKRFRALVQEVKIARATLEVAIRDSAQKAEAYKQAVSPSAEATERAPTSDTSRDGESSP